MCTKAYLLPLTNWGPEKEKSLKTFRELKRGMDCRKFRGKNFVFKIQKCLSSDPVESKVQAAVQQSNLTFPAPVVDSGRGCGMQDNQLSIVENIQSL